MKAASSPGQAKAWTRGLLRCGLAAGPAFVAAFVIEGGVRDGYRPLRHPVSSLALGSHGWTQTANFALTGTLFLAAAAGLSRAGDPAASRTGTAHNLAALPVFLGLPAAALCCGWRSWRTGQRTFALYSTGTAVTMATTAMLAGGAFGQSPRLVKLGGLFQRVSIITGFGWLTAVSARELRH